MRWYAAATVSLTLLGAVFGCGSDAPGHFIAPPEDAGAAGKEQAAGGSATAGKGGAAQGGSSTAGSADSSSGGDAGAAPEEAGSAGSAESDAGASSGGSGGSAGGGGAMPVPTVPTAPTGLMLQVSSGTSVHVVWTDNANDESGYNVYWSATADKPALPNAQLAAGVTSADAAGLTPNQQYDFWVEAYNDVGPSASLTGQVTPAPVPAAPTGLTVMAGATDAVLTWSDAALGETGYRVYSSTSATQPAMPSYELAPNSATYTVPGSDIDAYTKYYYWVVAYNGVGESMAATGSGTTGVKPLDPSGVIVDPTQSTWYVAVSWIDNAEFSSSYNVYWSTDDIKPAQPGATVPGGTTAYKMNSVLGNQTYRFWIEAVNPIDKSGAVKGTAPKATFELAWTDLYYDYNANTIRQGIADTFGYVTDNDATTGLRAYHTTTQALGAATTLTPAISWNPSSANIDLTVTQTFWSEIFNPNGSSFSKKTLVPPGPVTNFAVAATQLNMTLSWTAATNAAAYQVYMGSTATFASAKSYAVQTGTSLTINDLNPGVTLYFWVRALGAGFNGYGMPSALVAKSASTSGTYIGPNLALNKTAVALSSNTDAPKVVDGNIGSRWQAATKNAGEWIYVNLGNGNAQSITHVKLVWENAYASSFDIQVCDATCDDAATAPDTWPWVTAYNGPVTTLTGFPNYQLVAITPTVGQFVRMKAKTLGSSFAVSLWEFEILSQPP
jgi:hypothetical protein